MFIVEKSENWNNCMEATKNSHKGEKKPLALKRIFHLCMPTFQPMQEFPNIPNSLYFQE